MKRFATTLTALLTLTLGLNTFATPADALGVSDCPNPPPPSQTTQTITYSGAIRLAAIPEWASGVTITARGGWGQSVTGKTGPGGAGGSIKGNLDLTATPGANCLEVWAGGYGTSQPAFGWGNGGAAGVNPWEGSNGGGGGGASAVVPVGTTKPLLVAGGGGGGGGNGTDWTNRKYGTPGASGGDGIGAGSDGFSGEDGGQPDFGPQGHGSSRYEQNVFGLAGDGDGPNGGDGFNLANNEFGCPPTVGAGGGGGGGYAGGGAGQAQDPVVVVDHEPECLNSGYGFGAGGGAGGDSYASSAITGARVDSNSVACPNGSGVPACYGSVTIDWVVDVGAFTSIGGSDQSTPIGSRFAGPLQARVTSTNGQPIPEMDVRFELPAIGPSGRFIDGGGPSPTTVTVPTDASGTATTPPVLANGLAGRYSATADLVGYDNRTTFALANNRAKTSTGLWGTPSNPSVTGEPVTFVAQVDAAPSTAPPPAGNVQFALDGAPLGSPVALAANGEALSPPTKLDPGFRQITASYQPSPNFEPSDAHIRQDVRRANTIVGLTSSDNPSSGGSNVEFTATVGAATPATGTPTGAVTFTSDGTPIGNPVPLAGGEAVSDPSSLPTGPHTIEASYEGDSGYQPGDVSLRQSVGPDATATLLTATPQVAVVGQPVTVAITVKPSAGATGPPTGAVTVAVDGITICDSVTLVGAEASCQIAASPIPGPHSITAFYEPGSADFDASDGTLEHLTIKSRSAVTVEADPDPSIFGQDLGFHAQIDPVAPGTGVPTGAVTFVVDGTPLGDPVPLRDGLSDTGTVPNLTAGPHAVVARYGGDASFHMNSSGTTQTVDRAMTLSTLTPSADRVVEGTPLTFKLELGVGAPARGIPTGNARLYVDGQARTPAVPVVGGAATLGPIKLAHGAHQIRAAYTGSLNFAPIDALMTETALPVPPPVKPDVTPGANGRNPLLCHRALALNGVKRRGHRMKVSGTALTSYVGQRVRIRSRGRTVARPTVKNNGRFRALVRRPHKAALRSTSYRATAGGARSNRVRARQRLRIASTHASGRRQVRLRFRLYGGPVARIVLRRKGTCRASSNRAVHPVKIRPRKRRTGRRTIVVTVPRPAHSEGPASYWLKASGKRLKSLPVLVEPEPRRTPRG